MAAAQERLQERLAALRMKRSETVATNAARLAVIDKEIAMLQALVVPGARWTLDEMLENLEEAGIAVKLNF